MIGDSAFLYERLYLIFEFIELWHYRETGIKDSKSRKIYE